jgi:hypothetical protein
MLRWRGDQEVEGDRDEWIAAEYRRRLAAGYAGNPSMLLVELFDAWERGDRASQRSAPIGQPGKLTRTLTRYEAPDSRAADAADATPDVAGGLGFDANDRREVHHPSLGDVFGDVLEKDERSRTVASLRIADSDRARRKVIEGQLLELADILSLDPWGLDIVVDRRAATRLGAAGVRGLQEGTTVYLHPDIYDPRGDEGRYLLAHELVHAKQRTLLGEGTRPAAEAEATSIGRAYARGETIGAPTVAVRGAEAAHDEPVADEDKLLGSPPTLHRTVQMTGIRYRPKEEVKWVGGLDKRKQAFAAFIQDLVGAKYTVKLVNEAIAARGGLGTLEGQGQLDGNATQDDKVSEFYVRSRVAVETAKWLASKGYKHSLTAENLATLQGGIDVDDTWPDIQPMLPAWFTSFLYLMMMGTTQKTNLTNYGKALRKFNESKDPDDELALEEIRTKVYTALMVPAGNAVEVIRRDTALGNLPGYRVLWKVPAPEKGAAPAEVKVGPEGPVDERTAAELMIACMDADKALATKAATDGNARKKLVENLEVRLKLAKLPSDGDQVMHDGPIKSTRPPLSSSMRSWPALEAPFYDTPKGGDREFVMSLGFPDVFEAFRGYRYKWELMQVPDEDVKKLAEYEDPRDKAAATGDNSALKGATPGQMDVLGGRLDRDVADGKTDIKRSIFSLSNLLGPPGAGATSLVTANAMLRMVGTVIRTFIETLTKPSYEKTMPFGKDGLYVVRCTAWPTPNDKSIIDRSPSVAWMPVWVRPADAMSKLRVHLDSKLKDGAIAQFKAIEEALKDPSMKDPKNKEQREALEKRRDALRISIWGSAGDQFELEKKNLNEAMSKSTDDAEKKRLKERIDDIDTILKMRADRLKDAPASGSGLEGTFKISAAFVADKGQTMRPQLEAYQKKASSGFLYHVVDSTTKNSGHRDGKGDTRLAAIKNAVIDIFESDQGYGRGVVTLKIPDAWGIGDDEMSIRIEKSAGALQMEAIENIATVASIAAIAAAPFTGGASLSLLVPIGIVGAIPSAYRLLDRAEQGTLRFDMATALDIVNILGAAIGAGTAKAAGVAALKGIPLSKGYMILGLGNDGLGFLVAGAAFVDGIMELDKDPTMPKGLRNARIAELVGQQLIQIGMMVGASLVAHGKTQGEHFGGKKTGEPPVGPRVGPEMTAKFHEALGPKGAEIPVFRDEKGAKVKGDGVEIHFERDGYGLPTDARVIMGPSATAEGLLAHVKAAKAVVEYQGFIGWLRNLKDRITVLFNSGKIVPDTKSRAGIAKIEIEKISGIIEDLTQKLGRGDITPEAYGSKLKDYQEQIAKHEKSLNDYSQGPGIIAAHDNVAKAAEKAGYPPAPKDHFYYETGDGKFQLERAAGSGEPPQHIEYKNGKPVLAGGEVTGKVYDKTAIKELTKPLGSNVTLHDNATSEHVSVQPKPDGSYEVHYKPGTPEHKIKAAIDRHLELRAERPKDLKNPIKEDGSRWTGADEAAYLGRPTEEGYYWALSDGKLQIVSKDLDAHPKKVWDDKTGTAVVDTGAPKGEPSFPKNGGSDAEVRKAKENAFEALGGNDPSTEFGQWVQKCEKYLGLSKDDLIAKMKNPSDIQHRTVRHGLKENITPEMVKKIALDKNGVANDRAFLKEQHPGLYADAKTEADLKKADKAASHAEMLELTKGLGSADRGSIAEQWYKANYAPTAERHVTFEKEAMKAQGIELETTREPDIVGDSKIREVKHTSGGLGERDKTELKDYAKLLDKKIIIGEGADKKTYNLKEMIVVFPEPTGGHANADNIAKLVTDKRLSVEVFNSSGERKVIDTNDLKKGKFNVDGGEAGLIKAIQDFCK